TRVVNGFDPDDVLPQIDSLQIDYGDAQNPDPVLVLKGERFFFAAPGAPEVGGRQLGTVKDDVKVRFRASSSDQAVEVTPIDVSPPDANGIQTLRVKVPRNVAVGSVVVEVSRRASVLTAGPGGAPVWNNDGKFISHAQGLQ